MHQTASPHNIGEMKTEQQALHQMLQSYEADFCKKNSRQVTTYADVKPVAPFYKRYKEIKKEIAALQTPEK